MVRLGVFVTIAPTEQQWEARGSTCNLHPFTWYIIIIVSTVMYRYRGRLAKRMEHVSARQSMGGPEGNT